MEVFTTMNLFVEEVTKAEEKFPWWPKDIVHAVAILQEECGELVKACLDFYYNRGTIEQVKKEMVQAGAMVLRFNMHMDNYKPKKVYWKRSRLWLQKLIKLR